MYKEEIPKEMGCINCGTIQKIRKGDLCNLCGKARLRELDTNYPRFYFDLVSRFYRLENNQNELQQKLGQMPEFILDHVKDTVNQAIAAELKNEISKKIDLCIKYKLEGMIRVELEKRFDYEFEVLEEEIKRISIRYLKKQSKKNKFSKSTRDRGHK